MKSLLSFSLAILFVLLLSAGCSKKESKENAVNYLTKINEYIMSNEYKDLLRSAFKEGVGTGMTGINVDDNRFSGVIQKKSDEIAKNMGFKDGKELEAVVEKFKDDDEVKAKSAQMEKDIRLIFGEIVKESAINYLIKMNEYVFSNEYKDLLRIAFKTGVALVFTTYIDTDIRRRATDILRNVFGEGVSTSINVDDNRFSGIIQKKSDEIAKSMGFKGGKELEAIVEKYKDDDDVKAKSDQMEADVQSVATKIIVEIAKAK